MATTFTVSAGSYMRPFRRGETRHFPEAASQTFKRGDVLIMDAASTESRVKIAADQPVARIVGVAAADASGTTSTMIPVWLATPRAEFIVVGKASQAMDDTDLAVGLALLRDGTNLIWYLDNTDTTHDGFVATGYKEPAVQGDFQGYYVGHFAFGATIWAATI